MFALLEFITNVPILKEKTKSDKMSQKSNASHGDNSLKMDKITYENIMTCLTKTGLMQKVVQLPLLIDIKTQKEESIIRLCLKLLISIIFKGQSSQAAFAA